VISSGLTTTRLSAKVGNQAKDRPPARALEVGVIGTGETHPMVALGCSSVVRSRAWRRRGSGLRSVRALAIGEHGRGGWVLRLFLRCKPIQRVLLAPRAGSGSHTLPAAPSPTGGSLSAAASVVNELSLSRSGRLARASTAHGTMRPGGGSKGVAG